MTSARIREFIIEGQPLQTKNDVHNFQEGFLRLNGFRPYRDGLAMPKYANW